MKSQAKQYNRTKKFEFEPNPAMHEFDRRAPVNKQAAIVAGKGVLYHYDGEGGMGEEWSIKPQLSNIPPNIENLKGRRFGRLTVIGYYKRRVKGNGGHFQLWFVRCDCGRYGYRKHTAIKNKKNEHDACSECRNLAYLKKKAVFIQTGKHVQADEYL